MEQQRVRISDIAEELGLSTATVSNVIHILCIKIAGVEGQHLFCIRTSAQSVRKGQAP